ncbi:unnamed protein product [Pylaiella littoralis]
MSTGEAGDKNTVAATLADPQYKAGRKLIDDGRLEEAVNFFSGLLETKVQVLSGNEMCPALAPLYYEYGNSLLYNAEESGAVFGDAITDAEEKKRAMAIVEARIKGQAEAAAAAAESEGVEGGDGGGATAAAEAAAAAAAGAGAGGGKDGKGETGEPAPTPDQEAEEDLEIAWENLEMARRIYSELELTEEIRTAIAKASPFFVHLRLGDLNMVNGMYNEAADEFDKCLAHRVALPCRQSRGVADAHVRRAQALFYASTLEGADKDALVGQSLEQYRLAVGVFDIMLASLKEAPPAATPSAAPSVDAASPGKENSSNGTGSSNGKGKGKGRGVEEVLPSPPPAAVSPASAIEELEDVRDAIRETIDTMVSGKDMEALAEYKSGAGSTTVGFGEPSPASAFASGGGSGSGAAREVTTVGFGAPSEAMAATTAAGLGGASVTTGFGGSSASATAFAPPVVGGAPAANVMIVKRKGRPAPKTAAVAAGGGAGSEAAASPKKTKGNNE